MTLSPSTPLGTLSLSNGRSRMGQGPEPVEGLRPYEGATSLRPAFAEGFGRAQQGYGTAGKIAPLPSVAAKPR